METTKRVVTRILRLIVATVFIGLIVAGAYWVLAFTFTFIEFNLKHMVFFIGVGALWATYRVRSLLFGELYTSKERVEMLSAKLQKRRAK